MENLKIDLKKADKDNNGVVEKHEFIEAVSREFDKVSMPVYVGLVGESVFMSVRKRSRACMCAFTNTHSRAPTKHTQAQTKYKRWNEIIAETETRGAASRVTIKSSARLQFELPEYTLIKGVFGDYRLLLLLRRLVFLDLPALDLQPI